MTKKIFKSIIIAAVAVLLACFVLILGVLYDYYTGIIETQIAGQTSIIAHAVEREGGEFFEGFAAREYRITWIASDGTVLYDSTADAAAMENHADREEFLEAQKSGVGKSSRYSSTLTTRMLYCAERLSDGSVVRVASAQSTAFSLVLGMLQSVFIVLILAIILSALLASRLSKRIVAPLNRLDLEQPLENETYEELSPLLTRIERQHQQLASQLEELESKRREWNAVAQSMNEGIVLLSENNAVLSINESAVRLLDASPACVGSDILSVCRRLDIQELLRTAASGERAELVSEIAGRQYQINASPIISDGKVRGTVLLFFDVTEKLNAEQLRREFTANVSHELKTPLQSISGSAELIKKGLVEQKDMPRFIDRIYSESLRMIALVDDIIRLSKLDEGVSEAPREEIALKKMASEVAEQLSDAAKLKSISVSVSGDDAKIVGIPPLVREIIFNLCDNAIKYNRDGGSVSVTVTDRPDETVLAVADTGMGIPKEHQSHIFERFYRVDKSHSKAIGGTGLGLSIVKHAAKLNGASLELDSKPDEGSTFRVIFR